MKISFSRNQSPTLQEFSFRQTCEQVSLHDGLTVNNKAKRMLEVLKGAIQNRFNTKSAMAVYVSLELQENRENVETSTVNGNVRAYNKESDLCF